MKEYSCWCYNCLKDMYEDGWPIALSRMILCPDCGNKRCPKATDHNNACTNSNEPGQPGSRYSTEYITPTGSLKIGGEYHYDPLVVRNKEFQEIFKITKEGDIYHHGRLIQGDDELVKATTEFMKLMLENMRHMK
jgi:hypothetical protein